MLSMNIHGIHAVESMLYIKIYGLHKKKIEIKLVMLITIVYGVIINICIVSIEIICSLTWWLIPEFLNS